MCEPDYVRINRIIWRVLKHPYLSFEDKEDIRQEAAIAAWKFGYEPSTRIYCAALDGLRRALGRHKNHPTMVVLDLSWMEGGIGQSEIEFDNLLEFLSPREQFIIRKTVDGYSQAAVGVMVGLDDSQISRIRKEALRKLRKKIE